MGEEAFADEQTPLLQTDSEETTEVVEVAEVAEDVELQEASEKIDMHLRFVEKAEEKRQQMLRSRMSESEKLRLRNANKEKEQLIFRGNTKDIYDLLNGKFFAHRRVDAKSEKQGKFSDFEYGLKRADFFLDQLLSNGTTTALVFGTVGAGIGAVFGLPLRGHRVYFFANYGLDIDRH